MGKKNWILGGVLIILVAMAYIYQGPLKKWQSNLGKPKNFLAAASAANFDKIEITSAGKTTSLEKETDKWKIGGTKKFFANSDVIKNLLDDLTAAAKSNLDLISGSKEKKSEFKTDNSGTNVKLYQAGKKVADFIVGKSGNDNNSSYVSTADSANTYAVNANLASALTWNDWRDLTIFSSDKTKITKIRFQYPNREFTVEKIKDQWQETLPAKSSVSNEKIDQILDIMSNLTAMKLPEQTFEGTGLDKHLIIVQATGEGIDNTLMIGDTGKDGLFYAKKGDSDNIYSIAKDARNKLDQTVEKLK